MRPVDQPRQSGFHPQQPLIDAVRELPGNRLQLASDTTVFHQGERCPAVFVVERGYLKFTHVSVDGVARMTGILNAGQLVGIAFEGNEPAQQTASTKGETWLYRVAESDFRHLLEARTDLFWCLTDMLARRQRWTEQRLQILLTHDVRGRIVSTLHGLVTRYGGRCGHGHEVDIPLTQQELADLVGASRPAVSSILNALRRDGLVAYVRDHICICDQQRMNQSSG